MNSTQTDAAPAEEAAKQTAVSKRRRPMDRQKARASIVPRRRPADHKAEAFIFLGPALELLEKHDIKTADRAALHLPVLFNKWCRATGLRGKQKESVWRQIVLIVNEAREVERIAEEDRVKRLSDGILAKA